MSWISKNYEKAAIGAGILAAGGLAFLGWSKTGSVAEDFNATSKGGGASGTAVAGADKVPLAASSLTQKRVWNQEKDGERSIDSFTGIALFVKREAPTKPIDLIKDAPVHPPITNTWWLENRLDLGFADAPQRDPDDDGFTNLEEFNAKTDPNDAKSHPPLVAKLRYVKDESLKWLLDPGFESEGGFTIKYVDSLRRANRSGAMDLVKPGDLFFKEGVMKDRFKLLSSEKRKEMNRRTNIEEEKTYLKIEDQMPSKNKAVYEIPNNILESIKDSYSKFDRTAVMTLEAIGQKGQEFKVEEGTRFALPSTGTKKEFLLKKVTPEGIEVEYTDTSGPKTLTIPKGGMPATAP